MFPSHNSNCSAGHFALPLPTHCAPISLFIKMNNSTDTTVPIGSSPQRTESLPKTTVAQDIVLTESLPTVAEDVVRTEAHDRAVANALQKLSKSSPCVSTPSPKRQSSTEDDDPAFRTPTTQMRQNLSQMSTKSADECSPGPGHQDSSDSDGVSLQRQDTTDSTLAMRELLTSDDEIPNRAGAGQPGQLGNFTPSLLHTPSADGDISSQDTVSASQDSLSTLPRSTTENSTSAQPRDTDTESHVSASQDSASTPESETSPTASVSSSSQAREVADFTDGGSTIEHDEYLSNLLDSNCNRTMVRPMTRRPRLYQHQPHTHLALLVFDGIDDGVRLAATGLLWCMNERHYEVVLLGSVGWRNRKNNSRSHQVRPAGPVYAFVRDVAYIGKVVQFSQLRKVNVHDLFTKATPLAEVDVALVKKSQQLREDFLAETKRDTQSWTGVPTFKFLTGAKKRDSHNVMSVEDGDQPQCKRSKRLEKQRQEISKQAKLLEAKAAELKKAAEAKAAKIQKAAEARKARAEALKRTRELRAEIKTVVRETLDSFKQSMNRKLNSVRGSLGKSKKKMETDLNKRLANVSDDVRQALEGELGSRVKDLAHKVDDLTSGLEESNELRVQCSKRMRKMLDVLNLKVQSTNKKLTKTSKRKKKKKRKTKIRDPTRKENVVSAPAPVVVSRPPTPMVKFSSDPPVYPMYNSPVQPAMAVTSPVVQPAIAVTRTLSQTMQPAISHFPSGGQQYVSPAFASRNYAR